MNKTFFITLLLLLPVGIWAQKRVVPTTEDINRFYNNSTMVVIPEGNTILDAAFRQAVRDNWKATPYTFITMEEFDKQRTNPEQAFLMALSGSYAKDKAQNEYIYVGLFMGSKVESLNAMPEFILLPVGGTVNESENQYDMLNIFVGVVQQHMKKVKENPNLLRSALSSTYNQNVRSLKGKTLLVPEENIGFQPTQDEANKFFHSKLQLVSYDEISDAIDERANNTVIAYVVYPDSEQTKGSYYYKILVSTDTCDIYYYREQRIGGALGLNKWATGFAKDEIQRFSSAYN